MTPLIPAGDGLPVSDDTAKYTTIKMAMREFPRLRYRYREDSLPVVLAVQRRLQPAAQRPGRFLVEVYETEKLREILASLEAGTLAPLPLSETLEDRRARHITENARKLAKIDRDVRSAGMDLLRRAGLTYKQIGERMGVDPMTVGAALRRNAGQMARDPEEVLEWAEQNLFEIHEQFRQAATYPGYLHDIRGQLLLDPDGNPELNEDARQKALLGQVKVIEVETRLRGVIAPARTQVTHDMAPLEQRLLDAYQQLESRAAQAAKERLALEGDIVEGEILRDEETQDEGKKPRRKKPRSVNADDTSSGERGQEQQEG